MATKEKEAEKTGNYRKLCIINHVKHEVYIEIVEASMLDEKYGGDEEAYIRDLYDLPQEYFKKGYVSWEWFLIIRDYTEEDLGLEMPYIEKINDF